MACIVAAMKVSDRVLAACPAGLAEARADQSCPSYRRIVLQSQAGLLGAYKKKSGFGQTDHTTDALAIDEFAVVLRHLKSNGVTSPAARSSTG
ncbi:MAG: hypothetical protein ABIR94_08245 [Rubrivivax sp.]